MNKEKIKKVSELIESTIGELDLTPDMFKLAYNVYNHLANWIKEGCHLNDISSKLKVPNLILEHRLKEWCLVVPPLK